MRLLGLSRPGAGVAVAAVVGGVDVGVLHPWPSFGGTTGNEGGRAGVSCLVWLLLRYSIPSIACAYEIRSHFLMSG